MAPVFVPAIRITLLGAVTSLTVLAAGGERGSAPPVNAQASPPCNAYSSNIAPPVNIGVAITYAGGPITDVVYPGFKSYVKDSLPYEWTPGWKPASYQAGALAVEMFGWYHTIHWRGDVYVPTGECYHVEDYDGDQVYCAGIGTPNSGANCHGLEPKPASHAYATNYAVEQTWNWLLHNNGLVYPTHHNSGLTDDYCGEAHPDPNLGLSLGSTMSQNGSRACADAGEGWPQIVTRYYYSNTQNPPLYQGNHIYGQWHAAMSWGPQPWWPLSVSGWTWKWKGGNSCGQPQVTFDYGTPSAMKLVGDWDGNQSHTQGAVDLINGVLSWNMRNSRTPGPPSYTPFAFGVAGDLPVVGDWDNDGDWTPGVYRNGTWFLNNSMPPSGANVTFAYGDGNHLPIVGKWQPTTSSQGVAVGVYEQNPADPTAIRWLLRFSNSPGPPDIPPFSWGPWTGRPIAGDYLQNSSQRFGIGFISDEPFSSCTIPPASQGWNLKNDPTPGGIDNSFRYERTHP